MTRTPGGLRRTALRRKARLRAKKRLVARTAIKPVNADRRRRRTQAYAAHLRSKFFRALRLERFALDDYCCTCGCGRGPFPVSELRADHKTYARFGREVLDDLRTMWVTHHDAKDGWKWQGRPRTR